MRHVRNVVVGCLSANFHNVKYARLLIVVFVKKECAHASQPREATDDPPSVSASELLLTDLNEKTELLRVVNAKALQFEAR